MALVTFQHIRLQQRVVLVTLYRNAVVGGPTGFVLTADKPETLVQVFAFKFMSEIALNLRRAELPDRM